MKFYFALLLSFTNTYSMQQEITRYEDLPEVNIGYLDIVETDMNSSDMQHKPSFFEEFSEYNNQTEHYDLNNPIYLSHPNANENFDNQFIESSNDFLDTLLDEHYEPIGSEIYDEPIAQEKKFKCTFDNCNKSFRSSNDLKRHILIHTAEKPYKCDLCEFSSKQYGNLKTHRLIHTGEKPYLCDMCEFSTTHSGNLKKHKLIHANRKPFKCNICDYSCRSSSHLKSHTLIHTGEKPYKCDLCGRCFTERKTLKTHKLIHNGEKPHKCDLCDFTSRTARKLKSHKITHSSAIHYTCESCNTAYNSARYLKAHIATHATEKQHTCDICDSAFIDASTLDLHKKNNHTKRDLEEFSMHGNDTENDYLNTMFNQSFETSKRNKLSDHE